MLEEYENTFIIVGMKAFKNVFFIFCAILAGQLWGVDFDASPKNVKVLGRTYFDGSVLWTGFSASGATFKTKTSKLEITFAGDSSTPVRKVEGQTGLARVAVYVNGERTCDELISKKEQKIVVFEQVAPKDCEVMILKISESANSICGIKSISVDDSSTLSPLPAKKCRIEFIGDSITCGYGVDDENRDHNFSTSTEDATKTYAYKTASGLNADWSFVSLSGWGIYSGFSANGQRSDKQLVPSVYDKFAYSYTSFGSGNQSPQKIAWNFSDFTPDVIVINLGTNDASWTKNDSKRCGQYENAYLNFLKTVREKNPKAHIVCALGIMGQDLYTSIQKAVSNYTDETGDTNISTLKFAQQNMGDGIAADWHPTEKTHTKAANVLLQHIKDKTGFNYVQQK